MIRFLVSLAVRLIAAAIGLVAAAAILDDMALEVSGFLIAVALFVGVDLVAQPLIVKVALRHSSALSGSSALIATFVALVVTAIVSDGLRIDGALTWVLATVIVWAVELLAGIVLPAVVFKRWLTERQQPTTPRVRTYRP